MYGYVTRAILLGICYLDKLQPQASNDKNEPIHTPKQAVKVHRLSL